MPKKRKVVTRPTSNTASHISPSGKSNYKHFLSTYIAGTGTGKHKTQLAAPKVRNWQDVDLSTPQGEIVDEIAKKFNTTNSLGIDNVPKYGDAGGDNLYGADATGRLTKTNMTLSPPPFTNKEYGPSPQTTGHELIHANDHQSVNPIPTLDTDRFPGLNLDRLNPRVWANLGDLAKTGSATGPMADFGEFESSVGKIQDKIDLTHAFKPTPGAPESGYPFNQAYIKREMSAHKNAPYLVSSLLNTSSPDWTKLFDDIHGVTTSSNTLGEVPNREFYLNRASEFPAFISENLTRPWGANKGTDRLSLPEARFLHKTLGNMSDSYHATDPTTGDLAYPIINHHITARRNSLAQAYYPTGLPPEGFSYGGRVKNKNLLSRFKKIRDKLI